LARAHPLNSRAKGRFFEEAVDGYFTRHRVKPGIIGWAQIHGWRSETNTEEKIQQRVVLLDIYIVAKTPFALLI
jgi:lipopolysaccharide/colanic/teichoic acid biosynthesis glycosyltransferase